MRMELLDAPGAAASPPAPHTPPSTVPVPVLVSPAVPSQSCPRRGTWCTKQPKLHIPDPFPDFSLLLMALKGFSHTSPPHPTPEMMELNEYYIISQGAPPFSRIFQMEKQEREQAGSRTERLKDRPWIQKPGSPWGHNRDKQHPCTAPEPSQRWIGSGGM